tara:strand:+ start:2355 stop:2894 length:540 start_codon:yes stop_codon:yes gene_type:complete
MAGVRDVATNISAKPLLPRVVLSPMSGYTQKSNLTLKQLWKISCGMKHNLKQVRIGKFVISILMLMMFVLSPVSNSYASIHSHDVAEPNLALECQTQDSKCVDGHIDHRSSDSSGIQINISSDETPSGDSKCCSSFCTTAIVADGFVSDSLRCLQSEFYWQPAPMIIGDLTALHRPPNA